MQISPVVLVMAIMKLELGDSPMGMGAYDLRPLWMPVLRQAGENHIALLTVAMRYEQPFGPGLIIVFLKKRILA